MNPLINDPAFDPSAEPPPLSPQQLVNLLGDVRLAIAEDTEGLLPGNLADLLADLRPTTLAAVYAELEDYPNLGMHIAEQSLGATLAAIRKMGAALIGVRDFDTLIDEIDSKEPRNEQLQRLADRIDRPVNAAGQHYYPNKAWIEL